MVGVTFRQATRRDFPKLAQIISSTEAWTCYGIDYRQALMIFENMEDSIILAVKGQEVVGFITVRVNGVGNIGAYTRMVAIAESYRSQGIGEKLVNYAAKQVFQEIPNLYLICSTDNTRAQAFYERVGFKTVGILDNLVIPGHDEILYRLTGGTLRGTLDIK